MSETLDSNKPEVSVNSEHTSAVASQSDLKKNMSMAVFGLAILIMLAFVLFGGGKKKSQEQDNSPAEAAVSTSAPPPSLPLTPQQVDKLKSQVSQLSDDLAAKRAEQEVQLARLRENAPIQMYANGQTNSSSNSTTDNNSQTGNTAIAAATPTSVLSTSSSDANAQFIERVSATRAPTTDATQITHLDYTVAQGMFIPGVLETAIDSDLPGMVRAEVSHDVYAEQGNFVLIPKGSRLVGQYSSGVVQGQNRVFVAWQRLIRPDGIDIQLGSPGTDALGRAGMAGDIVQTHFFATFSQAALLSIIGAGVANVGVNPQDQQNSAAAYREAVSNSFNQSAQNNLQNTAIIKPTIHVYQGNKINVFVARDLDFYAALNPGE